MRKMVYVFENGFETDNFVEGETMRDKPHTIELRDVRAETPILTPIRKAMLEQFGYVSVSLKDKVILT